MAKRATRTVRPSQSSGEVPVTEVEDALDVLATPTDVLDEPTPVDEEDNPIPASLRFSTEGLAVPEPSADDIVSFELDGQELLAFRPDPSVWAYLISTIRSSDATSIDRAEAVRKLLNTTLDEPSKLYIQMRLEDRADPVDDEFLANIVVALIEHWTPQLNRAERRAAAIANRTRRG